MFITLYAYHAKPHQAYAITAVYREWVRLLNELTTVSTELLSSTQDPNEIIMVARFQDETAAWTAAESSVYRAWYAQLARLADAGPIVSYYR